MHTRKISYTETSFLQIRDFLVETYRTAPSRQNWHIDRWNFVRKVSQTFHDTHESWPETVGIWVDEDDSIVAVVNSEGENHGEAFFQLTDLDYPDDLLSEFIVHAEEHCSVMQDSEAVLNLRVNPQDLRLKALLKKRGYAQTEWKETTCSMPVESELPVSLPNGFSMGDGTSVSAFQKALAHGRAFGYLKGDAQENDTAERAFTAMTEAPDYVADLDLSVLDVQGDVAAFATVWHDAANRIGILEPVGSISKYRGMGLGKAVIIEGLNRIRRLGARKMYVGSDQAFYMAIGFAME